VFHCTDASLDSRESFRVLTVDEDGGPVGPDSGMLSHSPGKYMDILACHGLADIVCESSY
jgi:hypothetical protein